MKRTPPSLRRCPCCTFQRHPAQFRIVSERSGEARRAAKCIFCEDPARYAWGEPVGRRRAPRPAKPGRVTYVFCSPAKAGGVK